MAKSLLAIGMAVASMTIGLVLAADPLSSTPTDAPTVHSRKGVPLANLGRGDEKEVIVEKDASPPLFVDAPAGTGELEWLTSVSEAVLKIRIERIESSLTEDNDWIISTVTAVVVDVLTTSPSSGLFNGSRITFRQDGGQLDVNGRRIHAVLPWSMAFREGKTYLVFATTDPNTGELLIAPESSFKVDSASKLVPLLKRGKIRQEAGVSLQMARQRIRAAVK